MRTWREVTNFTSQKFRFTPGSAALVPRVASTCHRSYYSTRLLATLAHTESNTPTTFVLFYSCLAD